MPKALQAIWHNTPLHCKDKPMKMGKRLSGSVIAALIVGCFAFISSPAFAASPHASKSAATAAYQDSMQQMMDEMHIAYTGRTDTDFIRGMIPHHQAAIRMSETVLEHGSGDPSIRFLARWIILSQKTEIGFMQRWLDTRGAAAPRATSQEVLAHPATKQFMADMDSMHEQMDIHYSNNADLDFVCGMIPHHQGAVDMAYTQLRYGHWHDISQLAKAMVRSQLSDIAYMRRWLARNGYECLINKSSAQNKKSAHHHHHH
jgi:uncharacterized protein (DUF305 family)